MHDPTTRAGFYVCVGGSSSGGVRGGRGGRVGVGEVGGDSEGAAEYKKRIEAFQSDMGEGWLKIYSRSQPSGVVRS